MYFRWVLGWPYYIFAEVVPAYLAYMGETSLWSFLLHTSFGWEGFDGSEWRMGAAWQGVAHFMLWSMMALGPAFDNSWISARSGIVRGVVRLYFQNLFSCVFFACSFFYFLLFLSHRLSLLLFSLFPLFTPSYSFSNQTFLAEWLFVMQSSAGRRVVCSARGGLSRDCYAGTLFPANEGNPLVFWWIAVTLLRPGRGDFSASGLSTFKKIALTSALDCTIHFLGIDVPGCAILVFRGSPRQISGHPKTFHPLLVLMWNSRFWNSAVHFFAMERGGKTHPPKRGPCNRASYVKKVVLAAVFIFLGQDVPGCAILVFPGNPLATLQKIYKLFLMGYCMFLQNVAKKIGKSGRPKVFNLWLRPMWKRRFWGATLHFFGIDVPGWSWMCHLSVPWQPPTSGIEKNRPPKGVSLFFGAYMKHVVLRFCCPYFFGVEVRTKSNHPHAVHAIVLPMRKR